MGSERFRVQERRQESYAKIHWPRGARSQTTGQTSAFADPPCDPRPNNLTSVPRSWRKSSPNDGMTGLKGNQPKSDLIVRSNSTSPSGDKSQQIPAGIGIPQNGDQFEFKDIMRILRRRRKLVFVTAAVFALSLVNAVYQRNANPIYADPSPYHLRSLSDESAAAFSEVRYSKGWHATTLKTTSLH